VVNWEDCRRECENQRTRLDGCDGGFIYERQTKKKQTVTPFSAGSAAYLQIRNENLVDMESQVSPISEAFRVETRVALGAG
jgi:hypothetical protein